MAAQQKGVWDGVSSKATRARGCVYYSVEHTVIMGGHMFSTVIKLNTSNMCSLLWLSDTLSSKAGKHRDPRGAAQPERLLTGG